MITIDWIKEKAKLLVNDKNMVCVLNSTDSQGVRTIAYQVDSVDWEYIGMTIQTSGSRRYWGTR
jgi:hypothetical protein